MMCGKCIFCLFFENMEMVTYSAIHPVLMDLNISLPKKAHINPINGMQENLNDTFDFMFI